MKLILRLNYYKLLLKNQTVIILKKCWTSSGVIKL